MSEVERESEVRVKEYAQLLDMRAHRIKKLEAQLRDVAYGTKQFKVKEAEEDVVDVDDAVQVEQLERGVRKVKPD